MGNQWRWQEGGVRWSTVFPLSWAALFWIGWSLVMYAEGRPERRAATVGSQQPLTGLSCVCRSFLVGSVSSGAMSILGAEELERYFPDRRSHIYVGSWNMNELKVSQNSSHHVGLAVQSELKSSRWTGRVQSQMKSLHGTVRVQSN